MTMVCAKPLIIKDLFAGSTYDNEAMHWYQINTKTPPASILWVLEAFSFVIKYEI